MLQVDLYLLLRMDSIISVVDFMVTNDKHRLK